MTDLDKDTVAALTIPQVQKARGKIAHVKQRHGRYKNNSNKTPEDENCNGRNEKYSGQD